MWYRPKELSVGETKGKNFSIFQTRNSISFCSLTNLNDLSAFIVYTLQILLSLGAQKNGIQQR